MKISLAKCLALIAMLFSCQCYAVSEGHPLWEGAKKLSQSYSSVVSSLITQHHVYDLDRRMDDFQCADQEGPKKRQIAVDFSYPEAPETVKIEIPYKAKSSSGKIVDITGAGLEKVLVERLGSNWGTRLDATLTDSSGFFFLPYSSNEIQYLKLSKPGFNTQLIKVIIKKNLKSQLNIALGTSQ